MRSKDPDMQKKQGIRLLCIEVALVIISSIASFIGLKNTTLNPSGAAVTPGVAIFLTSMIVLGLGIVLSGLGVFYLFSKKIRKISPFWALITVIILAVIVFFVMEFLR